MQPFLKPVTISSTYYSSFSHNFQMQKVYLCSCNDFLFPGPPYLETTCPKCQTECFTDGNRSLLPYFYYSPVIPFLQMFWKSFPHWARSCYYPWDGHVSVPGLMKDIYDTPNWQKHNCLQTRGNMGFVLNADGMAIFKSAKSSLWPIWLMNANLAPHLRYQ